MDCGWRCAFIVLLHLSPGKKNKFPFNWLLSKWATLNTLFAVQVDLSAPLTPAFFSFRLDPMFCCRIVVDVAWSEKWTGFFASVRFSPVIRLHRTFALALMHNDEGRQYMCSCVGEWVCQTMSRYNRSIWNWIWIIYLERRRASRFDAIL